MMLMALTISFMAWKNYQIHLSKVVIIKVFTFITTENLVYILVPDIPTRRSKSKPTVCFSKKKSKQTRPGSSKKQKLEDVPSGSTKNRKRSASSSSKKKKSATR